MSDQNRVFLVIDSRFGIVFASLNVGEALANLSKRTLEESACETLANPGMFRLKSLPLDSGHAEDHTAPTKDADPDTALSRIAQLSRINAQMFEGTIKVLGAQNMALHDTVKALQEENACLREKLSPAAATPSMTA